MSMYVRGEMPDTGKGREREKAQGRKRRRGIFWGEWSPKRSLSTRKREKRFPVRSLGGLGIGANA